MLSVLAVLALAVLVGAEAAPVAPAPSRLGVVRIQQIFKDFQYARDQETAIKEEFKKAEAEIENLKKQIKEKTDALRTDPLTGPGSKRFKLGMLKIKELEVELEDKTEEFAKMRRRRMAEFYRSVYEKFQKAVQDYAAKQGLDVVITAPDTALSEESSESDSPIAIQNEILLRHVQYIGQACDITKQVIDLMNANYAKTSKNTKQL